MSNLARILEPLQPFVELAASIPPDTSDDAKVIWFAHQQITASELRALAEFAAKLNDCRLARMSETENTSLGWWQQTAVNLEAAYYDADREREVLRAAIIRVLEDLEAVGVEPFHEAQLRQAADLPPREKQVQVLEVD